MEGLMKRYALFLMTYGMAGYSGGYFSVRDVNGVILFSSSPPPSSGRGFTGCAW